MDIDPIAIYAAVVSTVALGWQIQKERQARRPQVEVKISYADVDPSPWGCRGGAGRGPQPR
jgi:hypothetical protein